MGQHGRNRRDEDWNRDRDRMFEDRSEGNRWGDHPHHDRNMQMQRDRYATGQSGYSSGRSGEDPSLNYQNRNSGYSRGMSEDRQVFGTDDRFTGRQGSGDYSQDRSIYDHRDDNRSFRSRDYGPSESERGTWSTSTQRREQGEHRGKGPRGYTRSDERIKEMVCEILTEDAYIDASGIDVEVKNGEVILSGKVADRRTKRMAEDVLDGISGIKDITNQLKVSDDERQLLGRSSPSGNGIVQHDETRKSDDKKARA